VKLVEAEGRRCLTLPGDVGDEQFCREAVERTVRELGRLDVLVNNAAEQHTTQSITRSAPSSWNGPSAPTSSRSSS
jgi:NAD(P)-dependent dehydrogenase (short-subunit alcohol dehydrogenase family)